MHTAELPLIRARAAVSAFDLTGRALLRHITSGANVEAGALGGRLVVSTFATSRLIKARNHDGRCLSVAATEDRVLGRYLPSRGDVVIVRRRRMALPLQLGVRHCRRQLRP
jgi:hypothetical protein